MTDIALTVHYFPGELAEIVSQMEKKMMLQLQNYNLAGVKMPYKVYVQIGHDHKAVIFDDDVYGYTNEQIIELGFDLIHVGCLDSDKKKPTLTVVK